MDKATENASSADNQQESLSAVKLKRAYLSGFIEGEGCFYVGVVPTKNNLLGWQVICEFRVSQNPKGKIVLKDLKEELKCGYIKPNHIRSLRDKTWVFVIRDKDDLRNKVIPFFQEYPLRGGKKKDFEKFREILKLIQKKEHFTALGLLKIVDIAYSMNQKSLRKHSRSFIKASLR